MQYVKDNLTAVRGELTKAMGAGSEKPLLVVAVKYATDAELEALLLSGVSDVGENRVQHLLSHAPLYEKHADVRVHFIGTLQTNKVKYIIDKVDVIHSLDSERLAAEIERRAAKLQRTVDVLVELNLANEATKGGVDAGGAEALCRAVLSMKHLSLCGFMTMGPRMESEAEYRSYFRSTVEAGRALWQSLGLSGEPRFSMGMSESFLAAAKEGADWVRVGRRLFLGRPEECDSEGATPLSPI